MTSDRALGLVGAGGFGREVKIYGDALKQSGVVNELFFVESVVSKNLIDGLRVISVREFLDFDKTTTLFNIPISDSKVRFTLSKQLEDGGFSSIPLISETAIIYDGSEIGHGPIICHGVKITSNVKIGNYFHANLNSYVAHDCLIGDFVTFAPNVACNGGVEIHDHAYIGTGALIIQSTPTKPITIGAYSIVGMGSVVTRSVPPGVVVAGNPAKIIREL